MISNKGFGEVLKKAVKGMIPKNKLRLARLDRLKVYDGDDHPYKQNLIAFADEVPDMKRKLAKLNEQEAQLNGLREKFVKN
ncbi:54S ribosomal protein L23, mitochondrial [Cerrena zonata]